MKVLNKKAGRLLSALSRQLILTNLSDSDRILWSFDNVIECICGHICTIEEVHLNWYNFISNKMIKNVILFPFLLISHLIQNTKSFITSLSLIHFKHLFKFLFTVFEDSGCNYMNFLPLKDIDQSQLLLYCIEQFGYHLFILFCIIANILFPLGCVLFHQFNLQVIKCLVQCIYLYLAFS